ncbi:MAG: hypothetical protein ABI550_07815 [Ignavibacteriaceae bacterium]
MKTLKHAKIFIVLLMAAFISGCYTEVAMRDRDTERTERNYSEQKDNGNTQNGDRAYGADDYTTNNDSEYSQPYGGNNDDYYYGNDGYVTNNYYFDSYPFHRKFYSYYYPSINIGIGFGNYYDPFWYSSVWGDPYYYWNWCGSFYGYYPCNSFSYYYSGFYNPYYSNYYGYGGTYWSSNNSPVYRTRSNERTRIRNNDGLRGSSSGERGTLTRTGDGVTLDKEATSRGLERPTRTGVDKTKSVRSKDVLSDREERSRKVRDKIDNTNERGVRKGSSRNDDSIKKDTRDKNVKRDYPRYLDRPKNDDTRTTRNQPNGKRDNNTNETKRKSYEKPKTNDSPRSYSPPKRNDNPPKSYSPPQRSTPPSSTRSSGGNSSGGRSGSNSGGSTNRR